MMQSWNIFMGKIQHCNVDGFSDGTILLMIAGLQGRIAYNEKRIKDLIRKRENKIPFWKVSVYNGFEPIRKKRGKKKLNRFYFIWDGEQTPPLEIIADAKSRIEYLKSVLTN